MKRLSFFALLLGSWFGTAAMANQTCEAKFQMDGANYELINENRIRAILWNPSSIDPTSAIDSHRCNFVDYETRSKGIYRCGDKNFVLPISENDFYAQAIDKKGNRFDVDHFNNSPGHEWELIGFSPCREDSPGAYSESFTYGRTGDVRGTNLEVYKIRKVSYKFKAQYPEF